MKILMAGDTHGNLGHAQYLVRTAKKEGCDRVFVLGDFGAWEHMQDGVKFFNTLSTYCNVNNIRMYFLDGNHDKTSLLLEKYSDDRDDEGFMNVRPYIRYAWRGHRWTWDEVKFIALGGAYSVDKDWRLEEERRHPKYGGPGSLWFPEEEMSDADMDTILENGEPVDVILAHDKPRGSNPGWNRKDFPECLPNQDRLQRAVEALDPQFFLHGHLHYWYTQEMWHSHHGTDEMDGAHVTTVLALQCDPEAGVSTPNYARSQSWVAVDTEDLKKGKLW